MGLLILCNGIAYNENLIERIIPRFHYKRSLKLLDNPDPKSISDFSILEKITVTGRIQIQIAGELRYIYKSDLDLYISDYPAVSLIDPETHLINAAAVDLVKIQLVEPSKPSEIAPEDDFRKRLDFLHRKILTYVKIASIDPEYNIIEQVPTLQEKKDAALADINKTVKGLHRFLSTRDAEKEIENFFELEACAVDLRLDPEGVKLIYEQLVSFINSSILTYLEFSPK